MNKRGFTLMEVIIVIALMGILMAMATPSLITWRESAQSKEVAREILAGLRQSRSIAVSESRPVTFTINPGTREMTINGTVRQLPAAVNIRARSTETGWTIASEDDPDEIVQIPWVTESESVDFAPQGNANRLFQVQINDLDRLTIEINSRASGLARIN